jgi:hypothetical protein
MDGKHIPKPKIHYHSSPPQPPKVVQEVEPPIHTPSLEPKFKDPPTQLEILILLLPKILKLFLNNLLLKNFLGWF